MIGSMFATARQQRCYDHRLKELVRTSGDLSVALELGIPRSTAIGWLGDSPRQVVSLDLLSLDEQELRYPLIHRFGWRRPRLRLYPAKPKVGLRTTRPDQAWHIDTTVIRLLDGSKAFLHAVIDNFSRRILAWRLADKFDPANTIALLLEAERGTARSDEPPMVVADAGVENVNAQVDELIHSGVLRRVLALTELSFSNSMIEAWWRVLKHHWLYLNPLDSVSTLRRLVTFYVQEHNTRLPHSAFHGQTPNDVLFSLSKGRGIRAA